MLAIKMLNKMLKVIQDFKNEKVDISKLISDLEGLFNALLGYDKEWESLFLINWQVLEREYSSAVASNKSKFDDRAWKEICKAVLELENLILSKLRTLDQC